MGVTQRIPGMGATDTLSGDTDCEECGLVYFVRAAVQLRITVMGAEDVADNGVLTRKRWPSELTSYCLDVPTTIAVALSCV